ncbi:MAG: thioesterase family protein [Pseudomonadota bacterium]
MTTRPTRASRADFATFTRLQTRWMDNDVYGHMNNVVHYSLFDTAVNGWLMEQELLDPKTSASYGLVVETGCRYHAELSFPGWVDAGLRISKLGTSSVRYEIGLFDDGDDLAAAEGFFVHVYVRRGAHTPVPIEGLRRAKLSSLMTDRRD